MAHRFDYSDSDVGVYTAFDYVFLSMELEPMIISNSLFLGAGQTTGSITWPSGAGTISQQSHLSSNGAITTGILPDPLFSRAAVTNAPPAAFDASSDFTGLYGPTDGEVLLNGYVRFFGQPMPVLNWDDTATGPDEAGAMADFAANREAAIADYAAQIDAVLDSTISGQVVTSIWDIVGTGEPDQLTVTYTPDPATTLKYRDIADFSQDADGRTVLLPNYGNQTNAGQMFGPSETVEVVLTRFNDWFDSRTLPNGTTGWVDMGAGDDVLTLFEPDPVDVALPDWITVLCGTGDDLAEVSGAQQTNIQGGEGRDRIVGGTVTDILSGDAGDDELTGGTGIDTLDGGSGNDLLDGGDQNDRLAGRSGNDTLAGGAARDRILGGGGDDRIVGGTGNDFMTGGNGVDTFVFAAGDGRDRVTDLTLLDRIELDAALWTASIADFVAARVTVHGPGELRMATTATDFVVFDTTLSAQDLTGLILFV